MNKANNKYYNVFRTMRIMYLKNICCSRCRSLQKVPDLPPPPPSPGCSRFKQPRPPSVEFLSHPFLAAPIVQVPKHDEAIFVKQYCIRMRHYGSNRHSILSYCSFFIRTWKYIYSASYYYCKLYLFATLTAGAGPGR
jgi:hypothetical protein